MAQEIETKIPFKMNEIEQIMNCILDKKNFLLSGGAGSGKTYSLVQVIQKVIENNPHAQIACITYTNAAVREIKGRIENHNLFVSTIHDFLWSNIKNFQKELKHSLVELINDVEYTKIKISGEESIPDDFFENFEKIQYKEHLALKQGIISHDELLVVANYLFKKYLKLSEILKDKYSFIFIDEYQDTQTEVIEIFLNHLEQSTKKNIIGFFGDSMQAIYDDGIGDLDSYIEQNKVVEIKKEQNRRNPKFIIDLANKLRTDGIIQVPSNDLKAPNMKNGVIKNGCVSFLYSSLDDGLDKAKAYLSWEFGDSKKTKELNLTHNLIADKAEFRNLMDIYDKDQILKYKDKVKKYIKDHNISDDFSDKTFKEVIDSVNVSPSNGEMQSFINDNQVLYAYALGLDWDLISKIYVKKDQLLDDKKQDEEDENKKGSNRDNLIRHLFKIQDTINLYQNAKYNEFIRLTDFRISKIEDKKKLKGFIEKLVNVGEKTIEEIITKANEFGICKIDDKLDDFQSDKVYLWERVKKVNFSEFQKLYNYLEGKTPFSTQHKTKGAEFDNVLVILDKGGWNDYNFEYLFNPDIYSSLDNKKQDSFSRIYPRTQKIFYVCCTRAKENLAVYYQNPSSSIITKAQEWFGTENVISIN